MNKKRSVVALCIICAVWIVLSVALALFHGGDVIESERRQAASFPALTAKSVLSGEFAEGFEKWSTDRFPLREKLRSFKAAFNVYALGKNDNNKITVLDGAAYEINYPINEKSVKNFLDSAGVSLPGTWHHRDRTADPANRSLLYGNFILLCKELRAAPHLVYRNRPL